MSSSPVDRLDQLARVHEPVGPGSIREIPEDFRVGEIPLVAPSGAGEFDLVHVRKRECNTAWVAEALARHAAVRPRDVSWAGRKDRQAVTTQWFSVHLPGKASPDWTTAGDAQWQVLDAARHHRKLRVGALRGNHFVVVVRNLQADPEAVEQRLQSLAQTGVPNYFGNQRFGIQGSNLVRALTLDPRQRRARGRDMALSAARAFLFNEVLSERVEQKCWNTPMEGDRWMLADSSAVFGPEDGEETRRRCEQGEIDPTGPLWGRGDPETTLQAHQLESAVAARWPDLARVIGTVGMQQERRRLRLRVQQLDWQWLEADRLELSFTLERGAFATAVLRELVDTAP